MDLEKEKRKKIAFLIFTIVFIVLTIVGAVLVFRGKVSNPGCAVIPSLFTMISSALYHNSKKAIEENKKKKK